LVKRIKVEYLQALIREYDIKAAGPSILAEKGYIDFDLYEILCDGEKFTRNKLLGLVMKEGTMITRKNEDGSSTDVGIYDIIREGTKAYVDLFIQYNNLEPKNILEINHDAIFIKGKYDIKRTDFGEYIKFTLKNNYFSMVTFPVNKDSNQRIKLYSREDSSIFIRGGSFYESSSGTCHEGKKYLEQLLYHKRNKESKEYFKIWKKLVMILKKENSPSLINHIPNDYLVEILEEIA